MTLTPREQWLNEVAEWAGETNMRLYIVPKATPNADSRCIEVMVPDFRNGREQLAPFVPADYFLVRYEPIGANT